MVEFIFYYSIFAVLAGFLHFVEFIKTDTKLGSIFKWIVNSNALNWFGKILLLVLYLVISPISFIIELLIILCTIGTKKGV